MLISAGEYLCLEGDKATTLFIVKSGMILAETQANDSSKCYTNFGPGSIIDELSLLEGAPRQYTLRAVEHSELVMITREMLSDTLDEKPSWINSIIQFLVGRFHAAKDNKRKNDFVKTLPPLLFIISTSLQKNNSNIINIEELIEDVNALAGTSSEDILKHLNILQELGLLKIQADVIRSASLQIITLLYETIKFRATTKKVSKNILSMTDQVILSTFMKVARENSCPKPGGICTVTTTQLRDEAKKSMHGLTLTMRTMNSLIEKKLLFPSATYDIHMPLESIQFFYADFDKILDLLELNRVFPLLDKKLIV